MRCSVVFAEPWCVCDACVMRDAGAIPCGGSVEEYAAVNAAESSKLADAFLSAPFLAAQHKFLAGKGKQGAATAFWALRVTRPLWSKLL